MTEPFVAPHGRRLQREIDELDSSTLRLALDLARLLRDPLLPGMVGAVLCAAAGVVLCAYAAARMGELLFVSLQLPYLVSGGVVALGLVVTGAVAVSILGERRAQAREDQDFHELLDEAKQLTRAVMTHVSQNPIATNGPAR